MASIIVISGKQKGEFLPLGQRTSVIGRAETLPLQILSDLVSRKHLRIFYDHSKNQYFAEDMNSKHGVLINMQKINEAMVLSDGDEILIGDVKLMFSNEDFDNSESAMSHYKKVGERKRTTIGQ